MDPRETLVTLAKVQSLADAGQHVGIVELLGHRPEEEVLRSPALALYGGIARARLGQVADGERWMRRALDAARERAAPTVEGRALNALGALELEGGGLEEATVRLTEAVAVATRADDHATLGRATNNLGIIAHLRGDFGRAVGHYTVALAAFERARLHEGAAQALHNLAITHRDQGEYARALEMADRAFAAAQAAGDLRLASVTRAGRAEVRLRAGDAELARRESQHVVQVHDDIENPVGRAEALRVWAGAVGRLGRLRRGEHTLREVMRQADEYRRAILAAAAARDLAELQAFSGNVTAARESAQHARERYAKLRADWEVKRLDALLEALPAA